MKLKDIKNLDLIRLVENSSELFRLKKYRSPEFVKNFIGLGVHRSYFYGKLLPSGELTSIDRDTVLFNSSSDITILIEGIVVLNDTPTNIGSGNITFSGYGVLEVSGNIVYDGRVAVAVSSIIALQVKVEAMREVLHDQIPQVEEDFYTDVIEVEPYHKDIVINILSTSDYSVVLPKLSDVHVNEIFRFKNLNNSGLEGSFIPFSGELIEDNSDFKFFGRGTLSIKKIIKGEARWSITEISNLFDYSNQGKTTEVSFSEHNGAYLLTHNRGYKPIIEVYVSDGIGGFSDASVDIDHNSDMNSAILNLEGINSGYVRYI
jgi:hypothetical protein